ncbi:uncharacterized protein LOC110981954 [Acanthaster planci]|uniref:protein-tyrosine-phosphatase n=1 Tax=Acanthaster planci TaxID=133434 RepID=A0A8B7YWP4_ACAPL|nr:uncharacterized protein LOC110981954 [Acanthaster planci]
MVLSRWWSLRVASQCYLLWCVILGSKAGLSVRSDETQPQMTTSVKPDPKVTEAHSTRHGLPGPGVTDAPPLPEKTSRPPHQSTTRVGEPLATTGGGVVEPRGTTANPIRYTSTTRQSEPSLETTTLPVPTSVVPALTTPTPATTELSGTTSGSALATSPRVTTVRVSPPTTAGEVTTQRGRITTQAYMTWAATTRMLQQTTRLLQQTTRLLQQTTINLQPPPQTEQHPPLVPTRHEPTEEPPPPHSQGPPIETEKPPPPSKPHRPTRPRPTAPPRLTTRAVARPTHGPTPHISESTHTSKPKTPIPYPSVAIQLVLQETWKDFCVSIEDFVSSIARYSWKSLSLHYLPYTAVLNDTRSCPQMETERDTPVDVIRTQVDICIESQKGSCDTKLTESVGLMMQSDQEELQKYLEPKVLSVHVYGGSQATPGPKPSSSTTGVKVGVSLSLLITVSVVTIAVYKLYRSHLAKRRTIHNRYYFDGKQLHDTLSDAHQLSPLHHQHTAPFTIPPTMATHNLVPAVNKGLIMDDEEDYAAPNYPSHVLSMHSLSQFYSYWEAITEEFETLPDFQKDLAKSHSPSKSSMAALSLFHPPPKTRVPLEKVSLDNQHGFLNASFVKGYGNTKYSYIATTAPWGTNVNNFWEMVWEQQSRTIVCLCSPEEMGVVCPWYWPRDEGIQNAQLYGDILVMRQGCVLTENYSMSTLLIKNIQKNLCRPINHFWFTQWPVACNLVPSCPTLLLSFLLQVRQTVQESYGPVVVHCSDGCGRTGTLLSIDSAMRSMEDLCTVDVPSIVCSIRHDRGAAVLQRDHYVFIYRTLYEYSVMLTRGLADGRAAEMDGIDGDASLC